MRQSSPQAAITNSNVTLVSTKKFIRTLSYQGYLDVSSSTLADKVHGNNRRCCDRFFQAGNNPRQGILKCLLIQQNRCVLG